VRLQRHRSASRHDRALQAAEKVTFASVSYQGTTSVVPIIHFLCHSERALAREESAFRTFPCPLQSRLPSPAINASFIPMAKFSIAQATGTEQDCARNRQWFITSNNLVAGGVLF